MNLDREGGAEAHALHTLRDVEGVRRGEAFGVRWFTGALGSCSVSVAARPRLLPSSRTAELQVGSVIGAGVRRVAGGEAGGTAVRVPERSMRGRSLCSKRCQCRVRNRRLGIIRRGSGLEFLLAFRRAVFRVSDS